VAQSLFTVNRLKNKGRVFSNDDIRTQTQSGSRNNVSIPSTSASDLRCDSVTPSECSNTASLSKGNAPALRRGPRW
jgi:hypothetical protein